MINLLEYISQDSICFIDEKNYEDILRGLMYSCLQDQDQGLQNQALEDILSKSKSRSPQDINLGKGFALIHSRLKDIEHIHLAIGVLPGVRKLLKGDGVHTLLGVAIPESQSRVYLSLLARIGRMLDRPEANKTFQKAGKLAAAGDTGKAGELILGFIRDFEGQ